MAIKVIEDRRDVAAIMFERRGDSWVATVLIRDTAGRCTDVNVPFQKVDEGKIEPTLDKVYDLALQLAGFEGA